MMSERISNSIAGISTGFSLIICERSAIVWCLLGGIIIEVALDV